MPPPTRFHDCRAITEGPAVETTVNASRRRTPGWPLLPLWGNSPSGNLLRLHPQSTLRWQEIAAPFRARNDSSSCWLAACFAPRRSHSLVGVGGAARPTSTCCSMVGTGRPQGLPLREHGTDSPAMHPVCQAALPPQSACADSSRAGAFWPGLASIFFTKRREKLNLVFIK